MHRALRQVSKVSLSWKTLACGQEVKSKWSYYYEKRGWDENAKQRPHPLNTAPYTASEGAKALPEYYINP